MELQANVLMPSGMSANEGVLMYNTETKQLSYVKFLEQFSGRVNIISWIFIKLFRSARRTVQDDKIIFSISKDEILSLKYEEAGGLSYGLLEIQTATNQYKVRFTTENQDAVAEIRAALQ